MKFIIRKVGKVGKVEKVGKVGNVWKVRKVGKVLKVGKIKWKKGKLDPMGWQVQPGSCIKLTIVNKKNKWDRIIMK